MNHLIKQSSIPLSHAKPHQRFSSSSFETLVSLFLSPHSLPPPHDPSQADYLPHSSNPPNPISIDPNAFNVTQIRPFSTAKSDPSSSINSSQPIDAGSSIRKPLSLWPGAYHSPVTNALWEARSSIFEKGVNGAEGVGFSEDGLVSKTPSQSRTCVEYKFSSDFVLREQYKNPWNRIRMGKLVEDLDALAGTISYKHCCNNGRIQKPFILVTASVDKILLKKPILIDTDLSIIGAVTWVGRSSMEMQLEVLQSSQVALVANFTFVARDAETGKSALINQISPETEQEKLLWEQAEAKNKMRKMKRAERKNEIDSQKTTRINELLAEGRIFEDLPALANRDSILIRDTCLQSSIVCQPQQRNIHGRIFGGFLMRKAFELAFSTVYTFAGAAPRFVEVDHVDFVRPKWISLTESLKKEMGGGFRGVKIDVDVGNFLRMKSCVLYTELQNPVQPIINVEVVAHVTCPELRTSEVSNKFYFTFTVDEEAVKKGLKIRSVFPSTVEEARRVIDRMDAEHSEDE